VTNLKQFLSNWVTWSEVKQCCQVTKIQLIKVHTVHASVSAKNNDNDNDNFINETQQTCVKIKAVNTKAVSKHKRGTRKVNGNRKKLRLTYQTSTN